MMPVTKTLSGTFAAMTLLVSAGAGAAPTVYFGENTSPGGYVNGAPLTARTSFLASLSGVGTEDFSPFSSGATQPLSLSFAGSSGSITATLSGSGEVLGPDPVGVGRFNTSGATAAAVGGNWWDVSGAFALDFSAPIAAFGFYGTDIGDFTGQVTVALRDAVTSAVTSYTINNTVDGPNASLLFWGFIDSSATYDRITFGNTAGGTDFFGFDDMTIGDRGQINVPEPGSLALVGLAMAGLAGLHRRRKA